MLKFLIGLFASISSVFTTGADKPNVTPPLNTAIIAYQETYYAPVVADLGNFPRAKSSTATTDNQEIIIKKEVKVIPPMMPILTRTPAPVALLPPPPSLLPITPPVSAPPPDQYLATPEPVVDWYVPVTFRDNSTNATVGTLPEMTFNREFWRIEVLAYWAPGAVSKPPVEKDYFKLEVYEKGTDKLIYTMTSGIEDAIHKFQAFKKPGIYYLKTYLKNPSQFEITFTYH